MGGFTQLAEKALPKEVREQMAGAVYKYFFSTEAFWRRSEAGRFLEKISKSKEVTHKQMVGESKLVLDSIHKNITMDRVEDIMFKGAQASPAEATEVQKLLQHLNPIVTSLRNAGTKVQGPMKKGPLKIDAPPQVVTADKKDALINHLLQTKQVADLYEARSAADYIIYGKMGRHGVGNFFQKRFSVPENLMAPAYARWMLFLEAAGRRVSEAEHYGPKDEKLAKIVEIAGREKGPVYQKNFADSLDVYLHETSAFATYRSKNDLKRQSAYVSPQAWEQWAKNFSSITLTPRIAIPHAVQWINGPLVTSVSAIAKAMPEFTQNAQMTKELVIKSGALTDEIMADIINDINGRDTLLSKLLHHPGFNWERKRYLTLTGLSGKYSAIEHAQSLLQNPNNLEAKRGLEALGLNPLTVLARGLTNEDVNVAMFTAARDSMFIRSGMRTPFGWETGPVARVATLYKHFMFSEGKLIKDSLGRAVDLARAGNPEPLLKTLAYIGTVFPTAGALVMMAENIIRGKAPIDENASAIELYKEAMGSAAGFGIFESIFSSAKHRALDAYVIGPFFGTMVEFGQDALTGNMKALGKSAVRRLGIPGPLLTELAFGKDEEEKKKAELRKKKKKETPHKKKKSTLTMPLPN